MIVDFRRHPSPQLPLTLSNELVSTVEIFKFLGIKVSKGLKWAININSVLKKAKQRMRLLRKHGLPQELFMQFYTSVIESVLCPSQSGLVLLQKTTNSICNGQSKLLIVLSVPPYPSLRTCTLPELRQERAKSSRTFPQEQAVPVPSVQDHLQRAQAVWKGVRAALNRSAARNKQLGDCHCSQTPEYKAPTRQQTSTTAHSSPEFQSPVSAKKTKNTKCISRVPFRGT
ncbi:uncharacterized protein LOC133475847 [Phyllopteryx taeniolatus]|uniref:uncharacterized protein LOC133475847 n=1 Tax=Phyllopteryx taeniolatus TaxID=161469 RepID=UPI002AD204DF|nr:uncharacterized protein LOC133475847 [Phyllopteryx taeniolatus]